MNIFDVVLSTEDLLVLGPVDNVELQVDIGPTGKRGSRIFVGAGDPNIAGVIPSTEIPEIGDYFINSSTTGDYGWLYVYQAGQNNVVSWIKALKLQPAMYSTNISANFINGLAADTNSIAIPIANISRDLNTTNVGSYVVQVTAIDVDPVMISVQQKQIKAPAFDTLYIDLRAMKYSSGAWVQANGNVNVAITISVI